MISGRRQRLVVLHADSIGADYKATYGASTSGNSLSINFVTKGQYATNIGSRFYMMASSTKYQMFTLLDNEFSFDVDVSNLGCGLNGALYFVSMDEDGGMSKYPTNKAGAKYGTGYCDAQCPRDLKFINGRFLLECVHSFPAPTSFSTAD